VVRQDALSMASSASAGGGFDDFLTFAAACLRKGRVGRVLRCQRAPAAGTERPGPASS